MSYPNEDRGNVRLLYSDEDMALGCSSRIFFCLWRGRTTTSGVSRFANAIREYTSNHPPNVAVVTLIEQGARIPEPDARDELTRLLKSPGGKVLVSAVAFEGSGFVAAVVRGIATSLTGLTRQPFPHRVFANITEIAEWFESKGRELGVSFPILETVSDEANFRRLVLLADTGQRGSGDHKSASRLPTRP